MEARVDDMTAQGTSGTQNVNIGWRYVVLFVTLAVAPAIVQCVAGVSLTGANAAADGPFTIGAFSQFNAELSRGTWLPRWTWTGNGGLGSPIFFFYPPGVYFLSAPLKLFFPDLPAATVLGVMGILFRVLAILACAMWLRCRYSIRLALCGGALYALMPYVSIYNPQYRMAFAETGAAFVLPLVFLAIDLGKGSASRTVTLVSLSVCLLAMIHLPSTVAACGLAAIYAGLLGSSFKSAAKNAFLVLCAVSLGLGIAAFNLLPALTLLSQISGASFQVFDWQSHFLLRLRDLTNPYFILLDLCLLVPLVAVAIADVGLAEQRQSRPVVGVLIAAIFLTTLFSWPVWKVLFPLQRMQFPWRFLLPVSLMAAACLTQSLSAGSQRRLHFVGIAAVAISIVTVALSAWTGAYGLSARERTRLAMEESYVDAREYMPSIPAAKGWLNFRQDGGDLRKRAAAVISPCIKLAGGLEEHFASSVRFDSKDCSSWTVLPQFYFPGWKASDERGHELHVKPDTTSGFVSVDVKDRTSMLRLSRRQLPEESSGFIVSAFACLIWLAFAGACWRGCRVRRCECGL